MATTQTTTTQQPTTTIRPVIKLVVEFVEGPAIFGSIFEGREVTTIHELTCVLQMLELHAEPTSNGYTKVYFDVWEDGVKGIRARVCLNSDCRIDRDRFVAECAEEMS